MGNKGFSKDELYSNLERINHWIQNVDIKASILLSLLGIFIAVLVSSSQLHEFILSIIRRIPQEDTNCLIFTLAICIILMTIGFLVSFCLSVVLLISSLRGRIDINDYKQDGINLKSLLFFGSISGYTFNKFKQCITEIEEENIMDDIISQLLINSIICNKKFSLYNKAIKALIPMSCFLLLWLIFTINYIY